MARKLMGTVRFVTVTVLTVGIAFAGIAFLMPGDPASGTQNIATAIAPVDAPQKPSYLADVPSKSPYVVDTETPSVTNIGQAQLTIASAATAQPDVADANAYVISASALNVRELPTSQSASLFVLERGMSVEVAQIEGNWAQVTGPDGRTGWAFLKFLSRPGDLPPQADAAISE